MRQPTKSMLVAIACTFGLSAIAADDEPTDWDAVNESLLQKAPSALRALSSEELCEGYGIAMRADRLPNGYEGPQAASLMKAEAKRRHRRFDDARVKKEDLRIGDSECHLLASWGVASQRNRSVGPWGIHTQHVYGRTYIYTKNGFVTSWQD